MRSCDAVFVQIQTSWVGVLFEGNISQSEYKFWRCHYNANLLSKIIFELRYVVWTITNKVVLYLYFVHFIVNNIVV